MLPFANNSNANVRCQVMCRSGRWPVKQTMMAAALTEHSAVVSAALIPP